MRKNLCAHDEKHRSPNFARTKWIASPYVIDIWRIVVASEVCAAASRVATGGGQRSAIAYHRRLCSVRDGAKRRNVLKWGIAIFLGENRSAKVKYAIFATRNKQK